MVGPMEESYALPCLSTSFPPFKRRRMGCQSAAVGTHRQGLPHGRLLPDGHLQVQENSPQLHQMNWRPSSSPVHCHCTEAAQLLTWGGFAGLWQSNHFQMPLPSQDGAMSTHPINSKHLSSRLEEDAQHASRAVVGLPQFCVRDVQVASRTMPAPHMESAGHGPCTVFAVADHLNFKAPDVCLTENSVMNTCDSIRAWVLNGRRPQSSQGWPSCRVPSQQNDVDDTCSSEPSSPDSSHSLPAESTGSVDPTQLNDEHDVVTGPERCIVAAGNSLTAVHTHLQMCSSAATLGEMMDSARVSNLQFKGRNPAGQVLDTLQHQVSKPYMAQQAAAHLQLQTPSSCMDQLPAFVHSDSAWRMPARLTGVKRQSTDMEQYASVRKQLSSRDQVRGAHEVLAARPDPQQQPVSPDVPCSASMKMDAMSDRVQSLHSQAPLLVLHSNKLPWSNLQPQNNWQMSNPEEARHGSRQADGGELGQATSVAMAAVSHCQPSSEVHGVTQERNGLPPVGPGIAMADVPTLEHGPPAGHHRLQTPAFAVAPVPLWWPPRSVQASQLGRGYSADALQQAMPFTKSSGGEVVMVNMKLRQQLKALQKLCLLLGRKVQGVQQQSACGMGQLRKQLAWGELERNRLAAELEATCHHACILSASFEKEKQLHQQQLLSVVTGCCNQCQDRFADEGLLRLDH